jgi:8-hydroxy-5-deazaflavin:NADPH oxidoreductase
MRVGVLGGTGPAGSALAARLADAGLDVVIGSRSAERAEATCRALKEQWPDRELSLRGADNPEAADADVVIVATPWDSAPTVTASVAGKLAGKVVISMANALVKVGSEFMPLVPPRGSVAAHVQCAAPGARVVAAFQHLPARELAALDHPIDSDVLICADDDEAAERCAELCRLIPGLRPLYAGSLANAAPIESLTAVLLQLNVRYKTRAAVRFTGIDSE